MSQTEEFNLADLESQLAPEANKQQQLARAKQAIAGTTPLILDPPDCIVNLPRGVYRDNKWLQEAEVRELTGADEEALARAKETADFFDLLVAHGVVRIEHIDVQSLPVSERQSLLRELLIGERSQPLLAVLQATYGNEKALNVTCGACSVEQEVTLLLSEDFKPTEVENLQTFTYTYTTRKKDTISYRLVTGADQYEVVRKKGASVAEQNTLILSRCIVQVNGQMVPDGISYARNMSMKDREKLLGEMMSKQPDVDLTVTTACVGCGGDIVLPLGWTDLFRS